MSVILTTISNPFEPDVNDIQELNFFKGQSLEFYIKGFELDRDDISFVISINGEIVKDTAVEVFAGDKIAVVAKTEGLLASAVAGWVTSAVAGAAVTGIGAAWTIGLGTAMVYGATYLATMFVMGFGMSAFAGALSPDMPDMGRISSQDTQVEPTYSWGQLRQTHTENTSIPLIFGINRIAGQIINKFVTISGDKEILNVLLGICDHQIDSISDVRINNQPYTYFHDVSVVTDRLGSNSDSVISGFNEIVSQIDVGSKLNQSTPVDQQTSGTSVEKIKIIIHAPSGFYYTNNQGNLDSRSAAFSIYYRVVGAGSWTFHSSPTMSGATTEAQRSIYTIDGLSPDQYEVRVTRTNAAESSFKGNSDIYLSAIQEIVEESLTYPGLAKYAIKALATEQLSGGMPNFTCLAARNYVSVFDRELSFPVWANKRATSPAWICYALLVHSAHIDESRLIWSDWNEWADFCDTDIDGDYAFIINVVVQSGNFWDKVQEIARMGRASVIRRGTRYGVFVDKETAVVSHLFTMGNTLAETFKIQYLPQKDRANAVEVEYTDVDKDHTRQIVCVYSQNYLSDETHGQKSTIKINAAIAKNQAVREGVYRINSNKYLVRVITFEASVDSFACTVGDLFYFQHETVNYEQGIHGSRIIEAGNDDGSGKAYIELDLPVLIEELKTYKIMVRLSDDTLVEKTVTNAAAENRYTSSWGEDYGTDWGGDYSKGWRSLTKTLTLDSAWATLPEKYDVFLFGEADTYKKKYRLTNISRKDDFTREITGIEYIPEIYTENDGYVIEVPTWTIRHSKALHVIVKEFLSYARDGSYISNINISWHRAYTQTGSNWTIWLENMSAGTVPVKIADVFKTNFHYNKDLIIGDNYKIYVVALGEGATDTGDNTQTITIQGNYAPPSNVTGFHGVWDSIKRQVTFTWTANSEIDLDHYEIRQGSTWAGGTVIARPTTNFTSIFIDEGVNENLVYRIKAIDTSNIESATEDSDTVVINTADCPLVAPAGLDWTSTSNITSDGRDVVTMLATWTDSSGDSDFWHHYDVQLEDMVVNKKSSFSTQYNEFQWEVMPNRSYGVSVRSADVSGNHTAWVTQVVHTTTKDAVPPAAPTSLSATGTYTSIILQWHHGAEYDLDHFIIYRHTGNDSAAAAAVGTAPKTLTPNLAVYTDTPPDDSTYYYWIKAVDTSNNQSAFSAVASDHAPGVSATVADGSITTVKIADDAIEAPKIAANAVTAAKIYAGAVGADKIAANAVIAEKINVANLAAIIANLGTVTAGILQSSTMNSSGNPILEINLNSGSISIAADNERVSLDSGSLSFFKTFDGTEIQYKSLKRAPKGTASHGEDVIIGYFSSEPSVALAPYNLKSYSASNSSVDQAFKLEAINLREVDPDTPTTDAAGSKYWAFEVSAQLLSGAGQDVQSINRTETSAADPGTITIDQNDTANMTTPGNVNAVEVSVEILTTRGTGTAGVYYNRKATLKLYIDNTLENTKVVTTPLAGQTGFISTSIASGAVTAGSHNVKVTCDYANNSGTFGSSSYEYTNRTSTSSPNQTALAEGAISGGSAYPASDTEYVNFPQPATSGWSVYQVDYTMNYDYELAAVIGGGASPGTTASVTASFFGVSHSISGTISSGSGNSRTASVTKSSLSSSFSLSAWGGAHVGSGADYWAGTKARIKCNTLTVKVYLRRTQSGSTAIDNRLKVVEYTYDIASGSVISTGIAKWVATGE